MSRTKGSAFDHAGSFNIPCGSLSRQQLHNSSNSNTMSNIPKIATGIAITEQERVIRVVIRKSSPGFGRSWIPASNPQPSTPMPWFSCESSGADASAISRPKAAATRFWAAANWKAKELKIYRQLNPKVSMVDGK